MKANAKLRRALLKLNIARNIKERKNKTNKIE